MSLRRCFVGIMPALAAGLLCVQPAAAQPKPNIIFIMADDLRERPNLPVK